MYTYIYIYTYKHTSSFLYEKRSFCVCHVVYLILCVLCCVCHFVCAMLCIARESPSWFTQNDPFIYKKRPFMSVFVRHFVYAIACMSLCICQENVLWKEDILLTNTQWHTLNVLSSCYTMSECLLFMSHNVIVCLSRECFMGWLQIVGSIEL